MQFAIDLIQKIPAGWPRWATLAAIIAAYFFFPDIVKKLGRGEKEKRDDRKTDAISTNEEAAF